MKRVGYKDMREYMDLLDQMGLMKRIQAEVDLNGELGAISARALDERGPGLLFENIKGYPGLRVAANILSTTEQLAVAFNTEEDDVEIYNVISHGKANPIPPRLVESAPCQEVVISGPDLDVNMIPTPIWHEKDGGPYIGTTAGVITMDPDTGYHNSGMYRCMIKDRNLITIEARGDHEVGEEPTSRGPQGGHVDILKYEQRGQNAPVALAIGMDPMTTYVTGQGVPSHKIEHAEYAVAGAWLGEPLEVVKCKTNDLLVPASAEIIIEGEVLAGVRSPEGPWGENADIYNYYEKVFVMQVNCITHRRNPINYGLICRPLQDYPKFLMGAGLKTWLLATCDLVKDAYVFPRTGNRPFAVVAARVEAPGDAQRIIDAVEAMPTESYLRTQPRWLVIVDEDADVKDLQDLIWRFTLAVRPDKDLAIRPSSGRMMVDVPMLVIDATFKNKPELDWGPGVGAGEDPPVAKTTPEMRRRLDARWPELGL